MQSLGKTNVEKWMCSLYVAILFLVISLPITYKFTNSLLKKVCVLANKNGCPTLCGLLVHAVVFMLLLRLGMGLKNNVYEGLQSYPPGPGDDLLSNIPAPQ